VFKKVIVVVFTLFVFWGCKNESSKIDIGFMGTLSGKYSDLGQATLQGVMLAFEKFDPEGRLNLVVKDDFGIPKEGIKIIEGFHEKEIKYVIGPSLSSIATPVVAHIEGKDINLVSPSASTSYLAGKKDNFMRTMPHNSYRQTAVISKYLINKLELDEVVILYDSRNSSYSNDIVKKFAESFMDEGGKITDVRAFNSDSAEGFSGIIENDKGNVPKLYYVIGSAIDSSLMIWQIKKAGFSSKVLIRAWAASNEFYRLGGEAVEGVYLFDYYIDKSKNGYREFRREYIDKYKKDPSWMSVYGYECARMVVEAVLESGGEDFQDNMREAAKNNHVLKNFRFDEYGDAYLPLHFFNIQNGTVTHKDVAE
jgi:branched-chain amino acid transport system substrate-binding protein